MTDPLCHRCYTGGQIGPVQVYEAHVYPDRAARDD